MWKLSLSPCCHPSCSFRAGFLTIFYAKVNFTMLLSACLTLYRDKQYLENKLYWLITMVVTLWPSALLGFQVQSNLIKMHASFFLRISCSIGTLFCYPVIVFFNATWESCKCAGGETHRFYTVNELLTSVKRS